MFIIKNLSGHFVSLNIEKTNDLQSTLLFEFNLGWVNGVVQTNCSIERQLLLQSDLRELVLNGAGQVDFITDYGNVEISMELNASGLIELDATAMANMTDENKVEINIEGYLK